MAIMEVIKFSPVVTDWIVFKSPATEFNNKSKLIVGPGQTAICVYNGKIVGEFEAGSFQLDSANLPFVKGLTKQLYGGVSPYEMEIYFFNKTVKLDFWWGISNGIQLNDPKFNVIVIIQARGQLGLRLVNKHFFLTQLVGSFGVNLVPYSKVQDFFRSTLNTKIKPLIISYITKNKISTLDLALFYEEIANDCKSKLKDEFEMFGFELINLGIETLEPRKEDLVRLNDILHRRAEFDIIGIDNYKTVRGFDVLETAASNESGGGISAGMGLGVGYGAGQMAGQMFGQMNQASAENKVITKIICPNCNHHCLEGAKFCPECGKKLINQCKNCNAELKPGMKFCSECGEKI
jgi:membrane protease subunit (stomatin/prohibitin family)